jgi:aspartyl-tRNA(Asn)/glutamyl-tRNA(Gln) amidotransferase subunit C
VGGIGVNAAPTSRNLLVMGASTLTAMSGITRAEVAHLAKLARLTIDDEHLDHYAEQLNVIIESVARVSEVAGADVPATSHPVPLINVLRPDVIRDGLNNEEALEMAPAREDGRFRVPRILDEE